MTRRAWVVPRTILRHRQDGAESESRQVFAGRQREQPGLRCESDAAHPDGWRHLDDRTVFLRSARLLVWLRVAGLVGRRLRHDAGLQPGQPAGGTTSAARSTTCSSAATSWWAPTSIRASFSGWGVRPSDWSFGASIQQEIFPRASLEVGYDRRWFTQDFTGGTVTDNLAIGPNDVANVLGQGCRPTRACRTAVRRWTDLYNVNPTVFGQVKQPDQVHEGRR